MTLQGVALQAPAVRTALAVHCPHRPPCPGCPRFGLAGLDPRALEPLRALAARASLPPPEVIDGPRFGFRHRARLAVRGRTENPKIGIFEGGSHRVVHIPDCRIHHPLINDVARIVRRTMVEHRLAPYSDAAHAGSVRYLQIVVERASETTQLVVVTREASAEPFAAFFAALAERLGSQLHSLWWNGQPERSNAVLGELWQRFAGPEAVSEVSFGTRLFYPPGAFGQSHLSLADRIATAASEFIPDEARLVEFYAGVGALGLPLAKRLRKLTLNELSPASLAGLERGVRELPEDVRARVRVVPGSAGDAAKELDDAEVVLVDPPRKGLDPALLQRLVQTPIPRLVYVSCGLPALLREAELLLDSGAYRLTALRAFALFPYTEHVETLAVFAATGTPST